MNPRKEAVLLVLLAVFINDLLACSSSSSYPRGVRFGHDYLAGKLKVTCHGSESIKGLTGEDWYYYCSHNPRCQNSSFDSIINNFTGKINYVCPRGGYIKGLHGKLQVESRNGILPYHSEVYDSLNISCCHDNQTESHEDCFWVGWQNCFGRPFKFWVPDGYYMAGVRSEYTNSKKIEFPRIWDFYVCK